MKNILITGGNRGIGKGLVEIFSKDNKVFFTSRDKQKAESVLDDIGNENIDYVIMDVASEDSVARGFQSLKEKTSSIDILINTNMATITTISVVKKGTYRNNRTIRRQAY